VLKPWCPKRPPHGLHPRKFLCRCCEKAGSVHAGDENVRKSVVVVVADSHTHAVHLEIQARAPRHIRKRAVAIVPVEPESGALALMSGPVRSVDEKNVLPAIAIVIEKCATGTQRLGRSLPP